LGKWRRFLENGGGDENWSRCLENGVGVGKMKEMLGKWRRCWENGGSDGKME
jgi:hypothetical protein